jgi:hypothetical protein
MRASAALLFVLALSLSGIALCFARLEPQTRPPAEVRSYVGFDRNEYPGDEALPLLRKSYSFASYWLSPPPGEKSNSWIGKRSVIQAHGFGFLLLYQGRTSSQLPYKKDSIEAGLADARAAAAAARRDGFPEGSVIFLDVEEGGRFFGGYLAYLQSWAESLKKEKFHPGIYCSGIVVDEGEGSTIISADDIRAHIGTTDVVYWVYNDACPPSPGCGIPQKPPSSAARALRMQVCGSMCGRRGRSRLRGTAAGMPPTGTATRPAMRGTNGFWTRTWRRRKIPPLHGEAMG